jgi:hypothetical protein
MIGARVCFRHFGQDSVGGFYSYAILLFRWIKGDS